ncbi:MAG: TetR family transcriptional regulator [Actinobacteria bacterium]|nr:TetR family transcriptional regulator [Actinomycetota bacterium]
MNQRDAQKLATRRSLSAAAIRLFSERGYDETRAGDIAAAVGVSERTFFLHFPTKDRSVFPDHLERVEALARSLDDTPPDADAFETLVAQVRLGIRSTVDSPVRAQRYRLINDVVALRHRDVINDLDYEAVFTEFLAQRWPASDFSSSSLPIHFRARVLAAAALSTARAALTTWAGDATFDPAASMAEALSDLRPWPTIEKDPGRT